MEVTFRQFLMEKGIDANYDEMINKVISDCEQFLQQSNYPKSKPLWRGIKEQAPYLEKQVRKDRKPTDTLEIVHQIVDRYFEKKFGVRFRSNSVFATSTSSLAEEFAGKYGSLYVIFPKGNFSFAWSPNVKDLYTNLNRHLKSKFDLDQDRAEMWESSDGQSFMYKQFNNEHTVDKIQFEQSIYGLLENLQYQNTDLSSAINSGAEIMINCNSYYAIDQDVWSGTNDKEAFSTKLYDKYTGEN